MRTDINGNYRNSAPCKNCYSVISKLGIKQIIFSSDENEFITIKTSDYHTEHISNGNRYLSVRDNENKKLTYQKSSQQTNATQSIKLPNPSSKVSQPK